jgi:dihydroflavonol-4-reductase
MQQALQELSGITGIPAPKLRVPYNLALAAAHVNESLAKLTGKPPKAPLAGVRMAKHKMWFNPAKAVNDLGLPQTPPREALAEAVKWFQDHGYAKR